jgi:HD-like signal output (HDOD) protein
MAGMPDTVKSVAEPTILKPAGFPSEQDFATDTVTIPVKLCNLPPFHSIANQVLALSADPDIDLQRLAKVMLGDPAFAAEVLFLANSSLFGFASKMQVLRHAVAVLGLERIKALAITVAMRAFLGNGGPFIRQCWRHSAACAIVAEEISPMFDFSGDRAYTMGLMHDIGRLGLLKSYASEIGPVITAEHADIKEVLQAEREAVNVDHGLAGAWLVKKWEFPLDFAQACARHHEPFGPADTPLLKVVKISCRLSSALGFAAIRYHAPATYAEVIDSLPSHINRAFPMEAELRMNVERRLKSFED